MNGGEAICTALTRLGVQHVFGLPGTQNIAFFEAPRRSRLRTILATSELAAGFMANGYFRSSGKVGVLTTIPGPGFAYTVPAIAEAQHDSAAVLFLAAKPAERKAGKFALQAIDQDAILKPLVKRIVNLDCTQEIGRAVEEAYRTTLTGEPGPVLLHYRAEVIEAETSPGPAAAAVEAGETECESVPRVVEMLLASRRPLLFVGQGTNHASASLRRVAEFLNAPVIATRSARGVLPEDHPLSLKFDYSDAAVQAINSLLEQSDLILAIGCKFSHNGTFGFRMRFAPEKLVHVDASSEVLNANYPARLAICGDAGAFLEGLAAHEAEFSGRAAGWTPGELARHSTYNPGATEPHIVGVDPPTPASFFAALRQAMPRDACLVTDSGLHQVLATRHFQVLNPRAFLIPSDFQSMGFGLPAAIGAQAANPSRPVVALIGDGGLAMSGMELLTAVRERIPLTVIVFNDGALGQIRLQQMSWYGSTHATKLATPDLELFAQAMGAEYIYFEAGSQDRLRAAIRGPLVTLVEVTVGDSRSMRVQQTKGYLRSAARRAIRPSMLDWIKSALGR